MKYYLINFCTIVLAFTACSEKHQHDENDAHAHEAESLHEHGEEEERVHFALRQFEALDMKVGELPFKSISSVVRASGQLEVPPQNEATVTAVIGANISAIKVIEGDEVKRGQVLAYLSHPNLTQPQSDYLKAYNNLHFLEQEYNRQKRLYEEEVGSGKTFQQAQADFENAQFMVKSLGSQLRQLGINPKRLQEGEFYDQIPVVSPIDGSIVKVGVKTGQYVPPQNSLFEIVNTHHIHADLMVFEKDVYKVKKGQRVRFTVESLPDKELYAEIYSVGKKFEQDPKAVHVHAEIENKSGNLIPGMYIKGQILTDSTKTYALPESAITREGDKHIAFLAEKEMEEDKENWMFTPIEVKAGTSNDGWVAVDFPVEISPEALFALNNAYYLLAEVKKGEAEHSH